MNCFVVNPLSLKHPCSLYWQKMTSSLSITLDVATDTASSPALTI